MRQAIGDPTQVISEYESFKCEFPAHGHTESTERQCQNQGFRFVPMVIEAHAGGWGKEARQVLDAVAEAIATVHPNSSQSSSLQIAQRLSISLQRENARAVLKRVTDSHDDEVLPPADEEEPQFPVMW